ncbi:hypothetical protein LTR36_008732 [Oleoguttula mirabilis]|uniref:Uncharacterized protein n=1 Tax=Oleoguttula mirabilis TaxID=1507867 RepID=A0AAV9JTU7_9PEZI|nr:hypothetical protein LTR36_008732 [Oleoguttula mirabilis]
MSEKTSKRQRKPSEKTSKRQRKPSEKTSKRQRKLSEKTSKRQRKLSEKTSTRQRKLRENISIRQRKLSESSGMHAYLSVRRIPMPLSSADLSSESAVKSDETNARSAATMHDLYHEKLLKRHYAIPSDATKPGADHPWPKKCPDISPIRYCYKDQRAADNLDKLVVIPAILDLTSIMIYSSYFGSAKPGDDGKWVLVRRGSDGKPDYNAPVWQAGGENPKDGKLSRDDIGRVAQL